jgi:hypothetical protein
VSQLTCDDPPATASTGRASAGQAEEHVGAAPAIPVVFSRELERDFLAQFLAELKPVGPIELGIVRDLARRAAGMQRWGEGTLALFRQTADAVQDTLASTAESSDQLTDAVLAGVVASDGIDRAERHSLNQSRGFYRALGKLQEYQARRLVSKDSAAAAPPAPFADEVACESYLRERMRTGQRVCFYCRTAAGYVLTTRRAWECSQCHRQCGLRSGTVMARSSLSLKVWFEAVRWLLWSPTISTQELATHLGVLRLTTVRKVAQRIRDALAHDDASDRLAGLDRHYLCTRVGT